jgi:hypothetical protein
MSPYREPEVPPEERPREVKETNTPWVLVALLVAVALAFLALGHKDFRGRCMKDYPHWR